MKAIILAAGRSSRLYPITLDKPKCLLQVGGKKLIEHQIEILNKCGITDIVIVTGYLGNKIKEAVGDKARYINFPDFATTNNLFTLYHVREELNDDFLCLFSDVLFEEELLRRCIEDESNFSLLVHNKQILADTMRVRIIENSIYDIGSHIPVSFGEGNFIGIAKFSKEAAKLLIEEMSNLVNEQHKNDYYTISLVGLASKGHLITPIFVNDDKWIEIDHQQDYERAKELFKELR
jgi:L-glutamine-phosphate cytidylyltransferase